VGDGHAIGGETRRAASMNEDTLQHGDPFDDPLWKAAEKIAHTRRRRSEPYIGCPVTWLKRVLPLVQSAEQLAVAQWLHRRRVICGNDVFTVPNRELYEDLGISRFTKYRTLRLLREAGAIAIILNGKRTMQAKLLW
jgi:hypothetical protein